MIRKKVILSATYCQELLSKNFLMSGYARSAMPRNHNLRRCRLKIELKFVKSIFVPIFAIPKQNGALAERLGTGLQNLLERFDSARHLTKPL